MECHVFTSSHLGLRTPLCAVTATGDIYRALFKAMSYGHSNCFNFTTNLRNCTIVFDSSIIYTEFFTKMNTIFNQADFFHLFFDLNLFKKLIHTLFIFVCFVQQIKMGSAFATLEEFVVGKVYVPVTKRNVTIICVGGAVQQSTCLQTVFYKIHEN